MGKGIKVLGGLFAIIMLAGVLRPIPTTELGNGKMESVAAKEAKESSVSGNDAESALRKQGNSLFNHELTGMVNKQIESPEDVLVMLDVGHGGEDEGCSKSGILEKDINLAIATLTKAQLEELGYRVAFTRDTDKEVSLEERVFMAEAMGADVFISIHQNACESGSVNGIETWYSVEHEGDNSKRLAQLMQMYLVDNTGAENRGIVEDEGLVVIRECTMPSCLIESGFLTNTKERELLNTPEYQKKVAQGIAEGIHLYFFPKTMYLTFDDGPSVEKTEKVLDILKEQEIKATFFLVGENVKKHPEIAKRIAEEGHTIGVHCNSHDYSEIYRSAEAYIKDFEEAKQIIYEATGVECKLFRFPGGSINAYNKQVREQIVKEMTELGYIYFDWNASLEDAVKNPECETLLFNAKSSTLGRKRIVMLAHDTVWETVNCLEELLEQFPEYEFLPLNEEVKPIQF